jgi:threonine dehydratase
MLDLTAILEAAQRIAAYIHYTPVLKSATLNELCQTQLYFKCENLQKVGAFKFRGAINAVLSLTPEQRALGVATHSSGNHAAALAYAAKLLAIPAYIVMPNNAPTAKQQAVAYYGGQITFCEPTQTAREQTLDELVMKTGALFIPPYNDERIIAGQGTAALELMQQVPELDIVLAPVGGGGLISGTAIACKSTNPKIKVMAAEPLLANDAYLSLQQGIKVSPVQTTTIADGLRTGLGDLNFAIIKRYVDAILVCSEEKIKQAMLLIWQRLKIVVEPSAAVPLAVILENPAVFAQQKVGIILSGGNLDLEKLLL